MRLALLSLVVTVVVACSAAATPLIASAPSVDVASPLRGIPDPGADPAVVLLDLDAGDPCTGALLAADVVLTARRCIALPTDSPCASGPEVLNSRDLTTIRVLVGDDSASAVERARGRAVLVPGGDALCGADIALLLLDRTIDDIAPLAVRPTGAAVGDHVRSVAFGGGRKLVRDHVPIAATSSRELELTEAPCDGAPGGPAIEEASGQVVGVLSRGGPTCRAADGYDVDTRADAFSSLVDDALAEGTVSHASHQARQKKGAVDLGASCTQGSDCAAGVCVDYAGSRYCTRPCSPHDRCPAKTRCMATRQSSTVCVQD